MEKKSSLWFWVVLIGVFMLIANSGELIARFGPAIDYRVEESGAVTLYSTSWCGYCAKTRRFFEQNNIPYNEFDVEKSADAQRTFQRLGGRGVPVVTVGSDVVHGYNLNRLRKLLDCDDCT